MKASKFSEAQIVFVLKQADEGTAVAEVCRKAGVSQATFYNWRKKYAGLLPSEMKRLKALESEDIQRSYGLIMAANLSPVISIFGRMPMMLFWTSQGPENQQTMPILNLSMAASGPNV